MLQDFDVAVTGRSSCIVAEFYHCKSQDLRREQFRRFNFFLSNINIFPRQRAELQQKLEDLSEASFCKGEEPFF